MDQMKNQMNSLSIADLFEQMYRAQQAPMRSEGTQREVARRGMAANPRPSILYDLINPEQSAVRDAMWRQHAHKYRDAGPFDY